MKLRNTIAGFVVACAALGGSTAMAGTMNIPYSAGHARDACVDTRQGGVMLDHTPGASRRCWVDVPLSIDAGHRLQQVTAFYGSEGPRSTIVAYLGYKDLRAARINALFEGTELFRFADAKNVARDGMAAGDIMSGSSGGVLYPDAFELDPDYAYFVRVMLIDDAEFFGLRVTYE
ncbi:MAG TPA: hypothetical protein VKB52_12395 [Rhodanobacteraceae bacterium]|nr:hypothetical protein [Rhodanobacteraceae bacterium]